MLLLFVTNCFQIEMRPQRNQIFDYMLKLFVAKNLQIVNIDPVDDSNTPFYLGIGRSIISVYVRFSTVL